VVAELLLLLVVHLALTGLPGVAAVLAAVDRGVRSVPLLLAIGLAATGVLAMLAFWAYYADPAVGEVASHAVPIGSAGLIAWILYVRCPDASLLRRLAVPLGLWALGSAFLLFLGFAHGGAGQPLDTAQTRFTTFELPGDNAIPFFFSEWFFAHGHHGAPPLFPPNWLASDRPPLQIGYVLEQRPFAWGSVELHYQAIGVILQQLWIVGLWALLLAARLGRVTRALVMLAVLVSGLTIVNGFFVWPKLLPAAKLLAAAALVLTPLWDELRDDWRAGALIGALCGVAMLGHGSSVFAVIPLALLAAYRGFPGLRWLGVALLAGALLTVPWSAYQKYGDPPGNHLTKFMLAGQTRVDSRGTVEAIADSYGEAGVGGALGNKADNFLTMVGGKGVFGKGAALGAARTAATEIGAGRFGDAAREVRTVFFLYLLPSLGVLLLGPIAMALLWRRGRASPREWSFALTCWAVVLLGCIAWGLLLFGNAASRTTIHVGSYAIPILAFTGAVAGLRVVLPRIAVYCVAGSGLMSLLVYAPVVEPLPGTTYSLLALFVSALTLGGFCMLLFFPAKEERSCDATYRPCCSRRRSPP
jgi:hypothetical protein